MAGCNIASGDAWCGERGTAFELRKGDRRRCRRLLTSRASCVSTHGYNEQAGLTAEKRVMVSVLVFWLYEAFWLRTIKLAWLLSKNLFLSHLVSGLLILARSILFLEHRQTPRRLIQSGMAIFASQ
ncbi:hypothetical protein MCOR27_006732 [Pyricularia oryzae]|uniref:Uncharacterized protein n=1 Tax=Pyricularia grisea TaxID=148305 RepID=A0ABQ8NYU5_PYRGI|nr:hypothetical protein MCOR02_000784 [Pyricularia oryzae]KAI6303915.1 hypothetical protein MCOR33_001084 [Pyricularia grisea]KAI6255932.1 hypothetical protein MCOR19_007615 [Pyricularia oryzae]KAI6274648.1 hypothetical protein MCOR26_006400 [Pyricularia oryzae]KAI6275955.1 hypothetical protein MCOR27_006732 [Pyricularia oryzae]